jgi:DNA-binding FadR family transcriptional regulator
VTISAVQIADQLASDVHKGMLNAGDMFPSERELCERYEIGRNVVREAMTILQGRKLADHSKGKRPRVVRPSLGEMMSGIGEAARYFFEGSEGRAHLEQARLFLETSMLRYAVEHATNAQVARMVEAIDECDNCLTDAEGFRDADVNFHKILAEIPGNPIFVALHEAFVERLMKSRPLLDDFKQRNITSNDEHRLIVKALIDRNADSAVDILTRHLTRNFGTYFHQALDV